MGLIKTLQRKMILLENLFSKSLGIQNKNIIITNRNLRKEIPKYNNSELYFVKKNNSMFQTIIDSSNLLRSKNKFLLTSCDCYGEFNLTAHLNRVKKTKVDFLHRIRVSFRQIPKRAIKM